MDILIERKATHGDFSVNARIAQDLKAIVRAHGVMLSHEQHEALDLICTKIARILAGDPKEKDHWLDMAGYARLGAGEKP